VTAAFVSDYTTTGAGTAANPFAYGNQEKAVLVLTIDANAIDQNGDDVFLRVVNNNYIFATDVTFENPIVTINGGALNSNTLPVVLPVAGPPVVPGTQTTFSSFFDTIYVRTINLQDGVDTPSFTIVGSSQNVAKSLVVDLTDDAGDPLSNSYVAVGAPVAVSAASSGGTIGNRGAAVGTPETIGGAVFLAAETITVSAGLTSQNDLTMNSVVGADNLANSVVPLGVQVNQAVV
jgi:hypothetical protein